MRDLTKKQFETWMRRNGFRYSFLGIVDEQSPSLHHSGVYEDHPSKGWRFNHRATIQRLLKARAWRNAQLAKNP